MATPRAEVAARHHRSWPRRLLVAANIFVAVAIVATAAGYGYLHYQFGRIGKLDLGGSLAGHGNDVAGAPMDVLLVGSDSRATLDPEEAKHYGSSRQVGGQRSDTIIVLRIDPKSDHAAMLSIPRDLWVKIAGSNSSNRINSAFEAGPGKLIQTINDNLGIKIEHYAQVDFNGFRGIVEALGGVQIYSPAKARDTVTGLNIPNPGCVSLNGEQALAFVRSRHYEYFENGRWKSDPTGDLGRINRQQDFIRRVLKKANQKAKGLNFIAINSMINTAIKNVQLDNELSTKDVAHLAAKFKSLDPSSVHMFTLPTTPANIGGASVLRLKQPDAQQVIDDFLGAAPAATSPAEKVPSNVVPSTVRIRVLNGSGAEGQARSVSSDLNDLGFNVAGIGEASSFRYDTTEIHYGRGQRDKALLVQSKIQGPSTLKEDLGIQGVDVVLITGGSFGGVAGGAQAATSTTGAKSTTTTARSSSKAPVTTTTAKPAPPQPQC